MSKMDWIKKQLLGSSTMPAGTGQAAGSPFNVLQSGHVHAHDGSCCGGHHHHHDHSHDHQDHDHDHQEGSGCCGHDHDYDEDDVTNPKGGCCS